MKIEYFKTLRQGKSFNKNQKVWIRLNCANHLDIWFKYRGKGRYVSGVIDKFSTLVGEIKEIDVSEDFARRVHGS